MNRFKVMVLFGLIAMSSYGQKLDQGSFDSLKGEKKIKVEFDYTNAVIKNMSYADYVAQEKNWDTGSVEILRKFLEASQHPIILNYKILLILMDLSILTI